jgi:hypothetical protein
VLDGNIENSEGYLIIKDKDEDKESWQDSSINRHFQLVDCYYLDTCSSHPTSKILS